MARVKATSTDVFARLAKGECANFRQNGCQGRTPCAIVNGEPCEYFANYVKPLLDLPDYTQKYTREAKITVALNPKAKVVRKTQVAMDIAPKKSPAPRAAKPAEPAAPVTPATPAPVAAPARATARPAAAPRPVPAPQATPVRAAKAPTKAPSQAVSAPTKAVASPARGRTPAPQPQLLLLDLAPEPPASSRTPARRSSRG